MSLPTLMKRFLAVLPLVLFIVACRSTPLVDESNEGAATDSVGMTVEQAREKADADGVAFRVIMEDGVSLPATMDYRPGRINATVQGGIVTHVDIEGSDDDGTSYDQESWKTLLPASCMSFFDGCNMCRRMEGGEAGCTKMYCETYEKPECKDGELK